MDSKIQQINRQWDFVLKSEGAFEVSLELTDHWGTFECTPFEGHITLYGKVFPQDLDDLLQRAVDWSEEMDQKLIDWVTDRKPK